MSASRTPTDAPDPSGAVDALCRDLWEFELAESPTSATYLGVRTHDARLDERGPAARARRMAAYEAFAKRLRAIPAEGLAGERRLTHQVLTRGLAESREAFEHHGWEWDLNQMDGPHVAFPAVAQVQPLATAEDAERLIARYEAMPRAFAEWIDDLRAGLASGRVAPRVAYDRVRAQAAGVVSTAPERGGYAVAFERLPASVPDRARLVARALHAITHRVLPAYRSLLEFLDVEYAGKAREAPGEWSIPGGEADYAFRARRETTTSLTPLEIHEIGLEQVAKNRAEMLEIARGEGHSGDLRTFLDAIGRDRRHRLATREAVLDRYREICARMDARLPEAFGILPRAGYEVKPLEPWREKDAPAAYYLPPAIDGSRAGTFYGNTNEPDSWPTYEMEALCFHEAVPGHHLQIAIAQEREDLPDVRRNAGFTAYVEGWAHYAERLADEMGAYSGPLDRVGMLAQQAWRAARLVVDTGLHALRWSRERAFAFLRELGTGPDSNVSNEVDRYIIWPGQALAYKVGHLTIARLRDEARAAQGARFSLRAFHDEVLRHGALPLSVLETVVRAWAKKA